MIHTVSVLKGYNASLGFFFLNLAFFIGTFIAVEIPTDDQLAPFALTRKDMRVLYGLQQTVHFLATMLTFLST